MQAVIVLFAVAALLRPSPAANLRWILITDDEVEVNGLPWFVENQGALVRLPAKREKEFRPAVWTRAQCPSGARVRFRTDSTALAIRLEYPSAPDMNNMHALGQTGVDLYVDGRYYSTAIGDKDAAPGKSYERLWFAGRQRTMREITIYLPLYKPVKVLGIGLDRGAATKRAKPFALSRPIVFYGTSITQGASASRAGMSYEAILGRMLNIDFVNLGFSANGIGEPEVGRTVADIDAACFVLDFAQNNRTAASLRLVYGRFIETLRAKHPDTPILAITPIYSTQELRAPAEKSEWQKMRDHIRMVVSRRIAAGDDNIQVVEGPDLLGPDEADGLADGTHPNDLGFQRIAERLATRFRQLLGL